MNSHTPKKVSVSCSLIKIKKKKGFKRQFWLCLWRSSWGKAVSEKNNISVPLGSQRNRPDRVPWSNISESGNEQIQNSLQFLWPELEFVQRNQLCSISRSCQHQKSQQGAQPREFQQLPWTPSGNLGQKKNQFNKRFRTKKWRNCRLTPLALI